MATTESIGTGSSDEVAAAVIHKKLSRDIEKLHLLVFGTKDMYKIKQKLEAFKHHFDVLTNNGRQWKCDKTTEMITNSGVFPTLADLLKDIVTAFTSTPCRMEATTANDMTSLLLKIIGNYFAVPQSNSNTVAEKWELRLMDVLQRIVRTSSFLFSSSVLHRALRLIANMVKKKTPHADPRISFATRTGLLEAILDVPDTLKFDAETAEEMGNVFKAFLKCMKACLQHDDGRIRTNSLGGLLRMTVPLTLTNIGTPLHNPCQLDVLSLISTLVDYKLQAISREGVFQLGSCGKDVFKIIISLYRTSIFDTKVYKTTNCIIWNLLANENITGMLLQCDLLEAIDHQLNTSDSVIVLRKILELLHAITEAQQKWPLISLCAARHYNHLCGSLVKVLRMKELAEYHELVLNFCCQLSPGNLQVALEKGLLGEIIRELQENIGVTSYDNVTKFLNDDSNWVKRKDPQTQRFSLYVPRGQSMSANSISSVQDVGRLLNCFRLVKHLININALPSRIQMMCLMPSLISLFLQLGVHSKVTSIFSFDLNKGYFEVVNDNSKTTESVLLVDVNWIIAHLCNDSELFPTFVSELFPTLLYNIQLTRRRDSALFQNIAQFLKILAGVGCARESSLLRYLSSGDDREQVFAAISLPIVFNKNLASCTEVLLEQAAVELSVAIALSLLKLGYSMQFDWNSVRRKTENLLPLSISYASPVLEGPTETSVCLVFEDNVELHVESQVLNQISPVFDAMLGGSFKEAIDRRITINGFSRDGFIHFMKYSICQEAFGDQENTAESLSIELLFEMLFLADLYMTEELYRKIMKTIVVKYSQPSTFIKLYTIAAQWPDVTCNVIPKFNSTLRRMIFLYFYVTKDINGKKKLLTFQTLYKWNSEVLLGDIRAILTDVHSE